MNSPYALLPIGIVTLLLYLLSYILSRLSIIQAKTHRQLWNVLLLITFFVTALIGLTMVIQVNYKLNIPFIKELFKWHVDFGIGMTMICIFHFLWHWDFYLRILKTKDQPEVQDKTSVLTFPDEEPDKKIKFTDILPAFALGLITIITQIVLLREFLTVFYGNELVIGIVLTNWMILTAIGAGIGRNVSVTRNRIAFQVSALLLLNFISIIIVILLNTLKNVIFQIGSLVGIYQILFSSLILLMPFCLLSGFMFTYLSVSFSRYFKTNMINRTYVTESTGSVVGGIVVSFILVYFLKSLQILGILLFINMLFIFLNKKIRNNFRNKWIFIGAGLSFLIIIYTLNFDRIIKKSLYPNQELLFLKDTPYGNLAITKSAEQLNFYENTSLLFTTNDPITSEEDVHYAMIQHAAPENILLISGGISGIINEILKYDVKDIEYVEINPWIIRLGQTWTDELKNEKVNVIIRDPRIFLKDTQIKYDVVLMNVPEPKTAQINRYYTLEFFKLLKEKMTPEGLISLALPSTVNYVSAETNDLNSIVFKTLNQVFNNVLIIPGGKNYILASNKTLNIDIPYLIEEKGIKNIYVNKYYLDTRSLKERSSYIMQQLDPNVAVNKDFKPVCYLQHLKYWMSQFNIHYWIPLMLILIFFIVAILRLKPITFGIFAGGFSGSSIEILLILVFQILYGYVYHYTGIIITVFMAGLAIGALYRNRILRTSINSFLFLQVAITLYALLLPIIFLILNKIILPNILLHAFFAILTLIISMITGMQFSLGSSILKEKLSGRAASLYSSDLVGSAFGALFISVFMIPILGVIVSSIIVAGLNFVSTLITFAYRRIY